MLLFLPDQILFAISAVVIFGPSLSFLYFFRKIWIIPFVMGGVLLPFMTLTTIRYTWRAPLGPSLKQNSRHDEQQENPKLGK